MKRAYSILKLSIYGGFIAVAVIATIAKRIGEFRDALGPAILYVVGGLAVVILLGKLFAAGGDERL